MINVIKIRSITGKMIASTSEDDVRVWSVFDGVCIHELKSLYHISDVRIIVLFTVNAKPKNFIDIQSTTKSLRP
jgi:hypothetical protein